MPQINVADVVALLHHFLKPVCLSIILARQLVRSVIYQVNTGFIKDPQIHKCV